MFRRSIFWIVVVVVILIPVTIYLSPETAAFIFGVIAFFAPIWLPLLLAYIAWPLWLTFVRSHYVMSIPYSTIELIPGPETPESAKSMELVFYSLYHRTDVSPFSAFVTGHVRVPWSFEVLAHAGSVRFFVHVPTAHQEAVESRIRAEYRDIDIDHVQDYSREIPFNPYAMKLLMREYTLAKADPYPLRTYVAHETEKTRRDAFHDLLEQMIKTGEKEYICISYIIRPHQREREGLFGNESRDSLHDDAQKEIMKLLGKGGDINAVAPSVKNTITAIETALKKPSFDCGVRALYIAEHDAYPQDAEAKLDGMLELFNDPELNSLSAYDPKNNLKWPMSEVCALLPAFEAEYFLQLYRRRAFFAPPYYGTAFILNTEELATVFHIPRYARASALGRIHGLSLDPPENLPV